MIICSKCKGSAIQAKFPDVLSLVSRVYVEGELENEINKELGINPPKLSGWEVAWSGIDLTKLDMGAAVSLVCKACGKEGSLEDFELVNSCRCRNITDDLILCRKFTCMACKNCVDSYECRHCKYTTCKYNSKYKGDETTEENQPRVRVIRDDALSPEELAERLDRVTNRIQRNIPPVDFDLDEEVEF